MDRLDGAAALAISRRRLLIGAGTLGVGAASAPLWADRLVDLAFRGGPSQRALTSAFPEKGQMILQRNRPPLLETPFELFDQGVFTPNDRFFVRWHLAQVPSEVNIANWRLKVRGNVTAEQALSLDDILAMPRVEIAAVNQCSGNSRGYFAPRVPGAQWGNGAMGNAKWLGVRLKDILARAGVKAGSVAVRFGAADQPLLPDPDYLKSLAIDHALSDEVIVAYGMNGTQLPLLNGFPLRLIVPGWFSTYWVKMLDDIEVLTKPDENYWMAKAYRVPTTPGANVAPGAKGFETAPISIMPPRSFITNLADGALVKAGAPLGLRGIAMGGDQGVAAVDVSSDGGKSWHRAKLGRDEGRYSFRRFEATLAAPPRGALTLMARATNMAGATQPMTPNWNPGGYMRCVVEPVRVTAA
jgi:DMSO/TMAO reductase YedYZ molybdopterin-dependent catalytic subunit